MRKLLGLLLGCASLSMSSPVVIQTTCQFMYGDFGTDAEVIAEASGAQDCGTPGQLETDTATLSDGFPSDDVGILYALHLGASWGPTFQQVERPLFIIERFVWQDSFYLYANVAGSGKARFTGPDTVLCGNCEGGNWSASMEFPEFQRGVDSLVLVARMQGEMMFSSGTFLNGGSGIADTTFYVPLATETPEPSTLLLLASGLGLLYYQRLKRTSQQR